MLEKLILTEIKGAYVIPTKRGRYLEIKDRKSYGISFCSGDGRIVYECRGKKTVSDRYTAVILPKGANYELRNEEGGDFPIINFETLYPLTDEFIEIPLSSPEIYLDEFAQIERLFSVGDSTPELFAAFYSMMARLRKEGQGRPSVLNPALEYIHKNIQDPELSNDVLAKVCRVSEVYFRRIFKKTLRISPKQYILSLRIDKAKELLSEGLCSVGDAAELCGFSSPYHFSRCFKQITGRTPTEYRSKH
ncbi:MAG: helix-turn-helix transcriptional regulator [Clostridia bacterium]|nr:helix-turn-helix transcriptional regulator [Clostridia bacterium]